MVRLFRLRIFWEEADDCVNFVSTQSLGEPLILGIAYILKNEKNNQIFFDGITMFKQHHPAGWSRLESQFRTNDVLSNLIDGNQEIKMTKQSMPIFFASATDNSIFNNSNKDLTNNQESSIKKHTRVIEQLGEKNVHIEHELKKQMQLAKDIQGEDKISHTLLPINRKNKRECIFQFIELVNKQGNAKIFLTTTSSTEKQQVYKLLTTFDHEWIQQIVYSVNISVESSSQIKYNNF